MSVVRSTITTSLDGFVAGAAQSLDAPLGLGGERLHRWMFEQPDENAAEIAAILDAGAFIMGRNMFGPDRGQWDHDWQGWWGDEPPYHAPVFVLSHFERAPLTLAGGTTFHFVTDGIGSALQQARAAAGERDVSVAGGASTINQFLAAGLIDELTISIAPFTLGRGERLFAGVPQLALEPVSSRSTDLATHTVYRVVHPRGE